VNTHGNLPPKPYQARDLFQQGGNNPLNVMQMLHDRGMTPRKYLRAALTYAGLLLLAASLIAHPQDRGAPYHAIDAIRASDLPPEARATLALIRAGGPFPYARDGGIFANREGLLPPAPRGTFREYTVMTPGRRDRGARRIVAVKHAEFYYTEDHYRSFRRIIE
jgi:ribonuclease T1